MLHSAPGPWQKEPLKTIWRSSLSVPQDCVRAKPRTLCDKHVQEYRGNWPFRGRVTTKPGLITDIPRFRNLSTLLPRIKSLAGERMEPFPTLLDPLFRRTKGRKNSHRTNASED